MDATPAQLITEALDTLGSEYHPNFTPWLSPSPGAKARMLKPMSTLRSARAMSGMILYIVAPEDEESSDESYPEELYGFIEGDFRPCNSHAG
jgi:hypothetical protein